MNPNMDVVTHWKSGADLKASVGWAYYAIGISWVGLAADLPSEGLFSLLHDRMHLEQEGHLSGNQENRPHLKTLA